MVTRFDRGFDFRQAIPALEHKPGDASLSILKAHLLFEEMLRQYLVKSLPNPEALEGSRLSFVQLVAVARSLSRELEPDSWLWVAIQRLNKLRNILAHELASDSLVSEVELYKTYCLQHLPPLPEPTLDLNARTGKDYPAHSAYSVLDIIHGGMLAVFGDRFGITVVDL